MRLFVPLALGLLLFALPASAEVVSLKSVAKGLNLPSTALSPALALLQNPTIIKNPTKLQFTCPDHAVDTGHEADIVNAGGVVIQTLTIGDPAEVAGKVLAAINVQPIVFGSYMIKVRATVQPVNGALLKSEDSNASNVWERAAMTPTDVVVGK